MKVKHISIKDYICRVKKKNKTRGRPSKYEMVASEITSYLYKKNKPEIEKTISDMILYGTGIIKVKQLAKGREK